MGVYIPDMEMPKACFKSVDELRMLPCELLCFCRNREGFKEPDELDVKASDCPLCETGWHTRVPTEKGWYNIQFSYGKNIEIKAVYISNEKEYRLLIEGIVDKYFLMGATKVEVVAWQKVEPCKGGK